MNKFAFKDAMKCLKTNNSDKIEEKTDLRLKFTRKSDIIKEKVNEILKETKSGGIFKKFEDYEDEREKWAKMRNEKLNKEKEKSFTNPDLLEIDNTVNTDPNSIAGRTKQFHITIDTKEAIQEKCEQNETRKFINADKYDSEYKCNELYNWFHLMFQEWEKELDKIPIDTKENTESREKLGIYKQCRGYMKPLLRLLKHRHVSKEIMNKLFEVMVFCLDKDYIRAHDKYIELAIGNAPWPMGVTMVGIHERSGRSRIYTSQVAHILNDENTKKYLQSVKRIMSLVQRIYPASPSNCVVS